MREADYLHVQDGKTMIGWTLIGVDVMMRCAHILVAYFQLTSLSYHVAIEYCRH